MQQLTNRGISLGAHAGKVLLLNVVASRLSTYTARDRGITARGTVRLPPRTINDRYVVRRAPAVARARTTEEKSHRAGTCASSICRKCTTLSTESCAVGEVLTQALAYQARCLQLSAISSKKVCRLAIRITAKSARIGLMSRRGCGKAAVRAYHRSLLLLLNVFYAAALHVVYRYASAKTMPIARDSVQLSDAGVVSEQRRAGQSSWHACEGLHGACCTPMTQEYCLEVG